jgi:hypothetical protein
MFSINPISKNIIHLIFENERDMGLAFLRYVEFTDSNDSKYNGKAIAISEFLNDNNDYLDSWDGFAVNSQTILDVISLGIPDKRFSDILIENLVKDNNDCHFIITNKQSKPETFDHELSHAYFHLNIDYYNKVIDLVDDLPDDIFNMMESILLNMGYNEESIYIEINAYFATGLISAMPEIDKSILNKFETLFKEIQNG